MSDPDWKAAYQRACQEATLALSSKTAAEAKAARLRLTDDERSAIGVAIQCVEAAMAQRHPEEEDARDLLHKTSCTLSRLFDRMAL